jgi:hypothetical protein
MLLARVAEKAALMGAGPWAICSGPDEIKAAYEHLCTAFDTDQQPFVLQFRIGGLASENGWMMMVGSVTGKEDGKAEPVPNGAKLGAGFGRVGRGRFLTPGAEPSRAMSLSWRIC